MSISKFINSAKFSLIVSITMLVVIITTGITDFYDTKYSIYLLNFCLVFSIVYGYLTISLFKREKVKQNRCLLILQGIIYAINICIISFLELTWR